ncbi:Nucleotide-binding universal stress protein, UspA family [Monaibacterium marinum]|uniref:Nucleotide-binding universal stress protein, UspA family n=1 Tax=Pontivivens marinum TaxID=1690039 RepID=A0A2C9CVG7_9RHOB|nr:universal stress protein [Monaibacterium marinum]SOH95262.1 Nucleotide-binding universal stress protein, UspA family [Monaibacterium marinum]
MILAAIDLAHPEHHKLILGRAHSAALAEEKRLAVISVLPDFGMSLVAPWFKEGATESVVKEAGEALHRAVTDALGAEVDATCLHILRQGTIYQEILTAAEKHKPSLIVMGAHRPDLRDYLIGPNAARVVRHAQCSVLVLRD